MFELIHVGLLLLSIQTAMPSDETLLQVRHDHDPWGKCVGELTIDDQGIEFVSRKEAHSRTWTWTEIQSLDRRSESSFAVLTWEDERRYLGIDRSFDFSILDGGSLSREVVALVRKHLPGTVTDRIPTPGNFEYQLPAKHLHTFDGCEGTLFFGPEIIVYESDKPSHSRTWNRKSELESVWSLHRYQLELHVFEENRRSFAKTRNFRFQLKQPLDRSYYEKLRTELRVEW